MVLASVSPEHSKKLVATARVCIPTPTESPWNLRQQMVPLNGFHCDTQYHFYGIYCSYMNIVTKFVNYLLLYL